MRHSLSRYILFTVAALLFENWGASTAAWAQDSLTDKSSKSQSVFEEIIVTARKRSESLLEVPDAITAFSAGQIETAGLKSLQDFTNLTPNISFDETSSRDYPSISIRGISQAQNAEAPIAVVIDGVQISHPAFISQDYGDIERVEVLRGPQGSLYGRNAIGGAINIVTKRPTDEYEGKVKLSYGNADTFSGSANISGPIIEDKAYFKLSGAYDKSNGQIKNVFLGSKADYVDSLFLRGLLDIQLTNRIKLDLRGNYGRDDNGSVSAEVVTRNQFDDFEPGFLQRNVDLSAKRDLYGFSAKLDYEGDNVTFTSITDYSDVEGVLFGDGDFLPLPIVLQDVTQDISAWTQEFRLSSNSDVGFNWLLGVFYQDRDSDNILRVPFDDGNGRPLPVYAVDSFDRGTSESYAVFGSVDWQLGEKFDLTLGLRYDEDKRTSVDLKLPGSGASKTFSALQPKVQLTYELTPDINLYATYGRGFRSGGFNAFQSAAIDRTYQDETADSIEVGVKGSIADGLISFSASAFRILYDNQQFFFITANPPSQNVANIEETTITGFELELITRPTEELQLSGGFGIIDPEIEKNRLLPSTEGNTSPQTNLYTFNLVAQYNTPLTDNIELEAYASYRRQGKKYWNAQNDLTTPAKDLINLRLFLKIGNWDIGVFAKNLLDEQYPTIATADVLPGNLSFRIPSSRHTYGLETRFEF